MAFEEALEMYEDKTVRQILYRTDDIRCTEVTIEFTDYSTLKITARKSGHLNVEVYVKQTY